MPKAKPATLTISTSEFTSALSLAERFASKDDFLPAISSVLLSEIDGKLHLQATDRYRAVIVRTDTKAPANLRHIVRLADVRRIRRVFTSTRKSDPDLTITLDAGELSIESDTSDIGRIAVTFPAGLFDVNAEYPDLLKIFRNGKRGEHQADNINPRYLADFKDFSERHASVHLIRRGSMLIAEGTRAVGAVMGMHVNAANPGRDWSSILGSDETEAVA